jgi:hypothetical protein
VSLTVALRRVASEAYRPGVVLLLLLGHLVFLDSPLHAVWPHGDAAETRPTSMAEPCVECSPASVTPPSDHDAEHCVIEATLGSTVLHLRWPCNVTFAGPPPSAAPFEGRAPFLEGAGPARPVAAQPRFQVFRM